MLLVAFCAPDTSLVHDLVIFHQQVTQIDTDLKAKASAYNTVKGSLQSLERKARYALLTKELTVHLLILRWSIVFDKSHIYSCFIFIFDLFREGCPSTEVVIKGPSNKN